MSLPGQNFEGKALGMRFGRKGGSTFISSKRILGSCS